MLAAAHLITIRMVEELPTGSKDPAPLIDIKGAVLAVGLVPGSLGAAVLHNVQQPARRSVHGADGPVRVDAGLGRGLGHGAGDHERWVRRWRNRGGPPRPWHSAGEGPAAGQCGDVDAQSPETVASPVSTFLIGPLAQFVAIPLMTDGAGARLFGSWFRTGPDRGMALLFIAAGLIGLTITLLAFRSRGYRRLSNYYAGSDEAPAPAHRSA